MEFLSAKREAEVKLIGIPFDSTSSFRKGSALAPQSIRMFSESIESFSPYLKNSLLNVNFCDLGDFDAPVDVERFILDFEEFASRHSIKHIAVLGGEHTVTYPVVKHLLKVHGDLSVIYFDAHADMRMTYQKSLFSHACTARRITELGIEIFEVGVRSVAEEEAEGFSKLISYKKPSELARSLPSDVLNKPVYISVDIDVFDPAYADGTGNPEPGGITPDEFFEFLASVDIPNVVGFDVVEVNPLLDISGKTSVLAAKIVREMLIKFFGSSEEAVG